MGNVWGSISNTAVMSQLLQAAKEDPWRCLVLPMHVLGITGFVVLDLVGRLLIGWYRRTLEVRQADTNAIVTELSDRIRTVGPRLSATKRRELEVGVQELMREAQSLSLETVDFDGCQRSIRSNCVTGITLLLVSAGFGYLYFGRK